MLYGKARKGSTVEISRKIGPGKSRGGFSPGQFGCHDPDCECHANLRV